jgi:hypothetical protein
MNIKRRQRKRVKSREEQNGLMVSPCRGCGREYRDKRYKRCATCEEPHLYAQAVEIACAHLPFGIDCTEPMTANDSRVKFLTECSLPT